MFEKLKKQWHRAVNKRLKARDPAVDARDKLEEDDFHAREGLAVSVEEDWYHDRPGGIEEREAVITGREPFDENWALKEGREELRQKGLYRDPFQSGQQDRLGDRTLKPQEEKLKQFLGKKRQSPDPPSKKHGHRI